MRLRLALIALLAAAPLAAQDNTIQGLFGPRVYHAQSAPAEYPPLEDLNPDFVFLFGAPPEMRVAKGETYRDAQARRVEYYQAARMFGSLIAVEPAKAPFFDQLVENSFEYGLGPVVAWADSSGGAHVAFPDAPVFTSFSLRFAGTYVGQTIAQAQMRNIRRGACFPMLWPQFLPQSVRKMNDSNCGGGE